MLNFAIGIFLARLLDKADYGIIGMLAIFSILAENFFDSGFSAALINKKEVKRVEYNAVFAFNLCVSVTLYLILFFCAPLIAKYTHEPRITSLSRFIFLPIIINACGCVPGVIMSRQLMVKPRAIINVVGLLISGVVGITLAMNGYSYWSLAWQQFILQLFVVLGLYYCTRWHPTREFSLRPLKEMFGFSNKLLITNIIRTLGGTIPPFLFGRFYGAATTGIYTQANKWCTMAGGLLNTAVQQVAQPVFVSVRDEQDRQRRVFRKLVRFTAFISFPAMYGLALICNEFIVITISEKWLESATLLRILCFGWAFIPIQILYQNLTISLGRSGSYLIMTTITTILTLATLATCYRGGITLMTTVLSLINIPLLFGWHIAIRKHTKVTLLDLIKDISPFFVISIAVMFITYLLTRSIGNMYALIVVRIVTAILLYYAAMRLFHAKIMIECIEFAKKRIPFRQHTDEP